MSCGVNDWDSQFTIRWEATKEALTTQRCHYITFQINKDILVHLSSTIITITFCNINTWDLSTTRFTLDTSMPIFLARYGQYHLIWMYKLEAIPHMTRSNTLCSTCIQFTPSNSFYPTGQMYYWALLRDTKGIHHAIIHRQIHTCSYIIAGKIYTTR